MKINQLPFFLLSVLLALLSASCGKSTDEEIVLPASLAFAENTTPIDKLPAASGSFTVDINWAYTRWSIVAGDVIEGQSFISEVAPLSGGDANSQQSATTVTIRYSSNNGYTTNRQKIIVKSITKNMSDTIIVSQSGKLVPSVSIAIDPGTTYQTITGFGGANAIWGTDYLTPEEMALAFGTGESGLGLSIFRVRLSSVKSDWSALSTAVREANEYQVKVLASPWSPPAAWKSNNSVNGGGYLVESHYADYAAYVNEFIQFMKDQGAAIDVVSIQNEPDWKASYEGCEYTTQKMFNFVKNYAGAIKGAKVLAAESLNFNQAYTNDILNDVTAAGNISIVAGHLYGSGLSEYPLAAQKGKEIWMTEHLLNLDSGNKPENWTAATNPATIWSETMDMVQEIHSAMSLNWNAYVWWYIRRYYSFLGDGERGTTRGQILKRGYAMAQFSKFIRPGYHRVSATVANDPLGLKITAYSDNSKMVVVLINPTNVDVPEIAIAGAGSFSSATAYSTSLTKNQQKATLPLVNSRATFGIDAQSITTVVFSN